MSREEILDLDDACVVEKMMDDFPYLLAQYVHELDLPVVQKLLSLGCDPNFNPYAQYPTRNNGFLHQLVHEYYNQHTLKGEVVLNIAIALLEYGADPDLPGESNLTAIQKCDSSMSQPFKEILLRYGARPEGNSPI